MNDSGQLAVGFLEKPYKVIKVSSGGIRFSISYPRRRAGVYCCHLLRKECPHEQAYTITLCNNSTLFDAHVNERINFRISDFYEENTHNFLLTWYNNVICLGKVNEPALLRYSEVNTNIDKMIGFVKFETSSENGSSIEWNVESAPFIYSPMTVPKRINGGKLRWVKMDSASSLPIDALIGGLEEEPLYIARARHRGSLCPGKYVKSKQLAFIPWGHQEIPKDEFEVLCGYDVTWVKSSINNIPENAFIGGHSEVHNEPLFIGRAWVGNDLIVGKVHLLYKTCYLPYRERELERSKYETLVVANKIRHTERNDSPCYMKMVMQPCF